VLRVTCTISKCYEYMPSITYFVQVQVRMQIGSQHRGDSKSRTVDQKNILVPQYGFGVGYDSPRNMRSLGV
jgi:hypothetical protein